VVSPDCNILRIPFDTPIADPDGTERKFDPERMRFVSSQINALLRYYDCVLFNDVDELFIVDTPNGETLVDYLNALPEIGLRAGMGVEVFQDIYTEPAYDPNRGLFDQRRYFRYRFLFCKPWIVAEHRQIQLHGARDGFHLDPNLLLLHLHNLDMEQLLARRVQRLEAFDQGRGGPTSRWKDDLDKAEQQMQTLSSKPVEPDIMPHTEFLEDIFPKYRTQLISGQTYPRVSGGRKHLIEIDRFVPLEKRNSILNRRYRFPDRFQGKV
jgi:hypothetical protein